MEVKWTKKEKMEIAECIAFGSRHSPGMFHPSVTLHDAEAAEAQAAKRRELEARPTEAAIAGMRGILQAKAGYVERHRKHLEWVKSPVSDGIRFPGEAEKWEGMLKDAIKAHKWWTNLESKVRTHGVPGDLPSFP